MKWTRGSKRRVTRVTKNADTIERILQRLQATTPHLDFAKWSAKPATSAPEGGATWKGEDRCTVEVWIHALDMRIAARCNRIASAISQEDYAFLGAIADEAATLLNDARNRVVSLADFGDRAVAMDISARLQDGPDPLEVLRFIRGLAQETYENQRLSYGLVLTTHEDDGADLGQAFENKRFKRLSDGFGAALVIGSSGGLVDFVALEPPQGEGFARSRRPWWVAGLAEAAHEWGGCGIALTRNGDICVVENRAVLFTQRAGRWTRWHHPEALGRLHSLWDFQGNPQQVRAILSYLYHVALDLSSRRSGGLLVVAGSDSKARELIASPRDFVGSAGRSSIERSLDDAINRRAAHRHDRRLIVELASLDGALVVNRRGKVLGYGAMTHSSRAAEQGARTRAAIQASRKGVAIKISSDGDISFFRDGIKYLEL